jgi:methyl-accepting chemotaxis protein
MERVVMAFENLSIRAKLALAFGGLVAVVALVAIGSLKALSDADRRFSSYIEGINARVLLVAHLRSAVDTRAISARNLVLINDPDDMTREKVLVMKAHRAVQSDMGRLKLLIGSATDASDRARTMVEEMSRIEAAYGPVALGIVDLALSGRKGEAIDRMNNECRPLLAKLVKVTAEYADYAQQQSVSMIREARRQYEQQRQALLAACVLAVCSAVGAGFVVTRSIMKPLAQAVRLAEAVACGDLSVRANSAGNNEMSHLLRALSDMNRDLGSIVRQVRSSSDRIACGSVQIAAGNADLSHRTEEQASALEETAASMVQLKSAVHQNADHACRADELAKQAADVAARGGQVVHQVVHTMRQIQERSHRIADIVGVIDSIAFQTNLLALNAAVEAARAGEQGRGFAVVASEVRGLAGRSATAAREIKNLITSSVEGIEQGTALVDHAGATMDEIVASIHRVTDIMDSIREANHQQTAGMAQVGEAMVQIDQVTQQNAALVEQSAAAAESLRHQAQQMVAAVSVFKLDATPDATWHPGPKAPLAA